MALKVINPDHTAPLWPHMQILGMKAQHFVFNKHFMCAKLDTHYMAKGSKFEVLCRKEQTYPVMSTFRQEDNRSREPRSVLRLCQVAKSPVYSVMTRLPQRDTNLVGSLKGLSPAIIQSEKGHAYGGERRDHQCLVVLGRKGSHFPPTLSTCLS